MKSFRFTKTKLTLVELHFQKVFSLKATGPEAPSFWEKQRPLWRYLEVFGGTLRRKFAICYSLGPPSHAPGVRMT